MKIRDKYILYFSCIVLVVTFAACRNKSSIKSDDLIPQSQITSDSKNSKHEGKLDNSTKDSKTESEKEKNSLKLNERKIIKKAFVDLEAKEFEDTINSIIGKVISEDGYVQNSNISGTRLYDKNKYSTRHAELVLRIPKTNFDKFLNEMGNLGNITRKSINGEDVTNEYFDTEAHLKALTIQEERLLELLKKTGELKDIIEIEKELSDVRYKIENLTGTIKKFDNLIDYSTVNININEVYEFKEKAETPITVWQKTVSAFKSSIKIIINFLKSTLIFVGGIIPFILIILLIHLILKYLFKVNFLLKLKNKFRNRNNP